MFNNKLSKAHFYFMLIDVYKVTELKDGKRYFYLSSPNSVTKAFIVKATQLSLITFCHNSLIGSTISPVFILTQKGVRICNAILKQLHEVK